MFGIQQTFNVPFNDQYCAQDMVRAWKNKKMNNRWLAFQLSYTFDF